MKLYHSNITKNIFKNCDNYGEKIIIEDIYGKKISGKKYKNSALFYAEKLHKQGIKKGNSVVIFIKDLVSFSYISVAVLLVGAKLVIIEPEMGEKVLEEKLKLIKPNLLIIEGKLYFLLKTLFIKNISKIKKYQNLLKYSDNIIVNNSSIKFCNFFNKSKQIDNFYFEEHEKINKNSESLVVFTGGTTSSPKGVVHTLESLEIMFERISKIIGEDSKIFYADLPHFILIGICLGSKVIVGKNNICDKKYLNILIKYKIDTTFSPPYRYNNFINNYKEKYILPETLRHICLGSAPIYTSFLEKIYKNVGEETKITCIYGMTEILPVAYIDGKEKLEKKVDGDLLGKVFNDIDIKILENKELEIYGKGLFKKYLGGKKIKKYKTGDLVSFESGNLIMKGRKKDMILRKDFNIYPSLYEPIINYIPGIIESSLVGIFNNFLHDEKVILYLEIDNKYKKKLSNKKNIIKKLKHGKYSIDDFALPDEIIFLNKIPRIGRQNKIDKNYLSKNYTSLGK